MKPGTIIQLLDGREGTVVYHGPDGYGIRWGRLQVDVKKILRGCPLTGNAASEDVAQWGPEAMLRAPYLSADLPCVGEEYEVVSKSPKEPSKGEEA